MKIKKSKPIVIAFAISFLCFATSATAFAVYNLDDNKTSVTVAANSVYSMDNIKDVELEGEIMFGVYERKIAELNGEISVDSPRINLGLVKSWINDGMNYVDIENKLEEEYSFPDFVGGSGVTKIEYWLDETGNDKILMIREQENIIHVLDSSNNDKDIYDVLMK